MFKKNPNRPPITISLKKVNTGYKVLPNEAFNPFSFKRITWAFYRRTETYAGGVNGQDNSLLGLPPGASMIQAPSHVTIPLPARWFDVNEISDIEKQAFPEFFLEDEEEGRLFSKSPRLYQFYRNGIVNLWRQNSKKYLSPALCRKNLPGDVSSIIRIHAFLEHWGLINFPSKEHSKGYTASKALLYSCLACQSSTAHEYYVTEVQEGTLLQLCNFCFKNGVYPECIASESFKKVLPEIHDDRKKQGKMNEEEIKKMLQLISAENMREKQIWTNLGKAFPTYTKEEILANFLELPSQIKSNVSFFQANEDYIHQEDPPSEEEPTIFENYENQEQISIAMTYYAWKTNPEAYPQLDELFKAATQHAHYLSLQQSQKSNEMLRMLTDVQQSKIELKAVFIQELEKLVSAEQKHFKNVASNLVAQALKNQDIEHE